MAVLIPTKKIPQLTAYGLPLAGTEMMEISVTGTSRRITTRDFVLPIDSVLTVTPFPVVGSSARQLISSPTVQVTDNGPGSTVQLDALLTGALPGNPTSLIGLVAINGVAVTWMRSDAAPALNQGIVPTWTGLHTFSVGLSSREVLVSSADPYLRQVETDAAANNRLWELLPVGEQLRGRVGNDAAGAFVNWLEVDRTLNVVDTINLLATTVQVNGVNVRDATNLFNTGTVPTARLGSGVADATTWLRGDQTWQALPGGFTGFANPTASVGLAAVNGAATTAMRSDAAPALSQAIAPTWSAQHIFSLSGATNSAILVSSAQPQTDYNETDAAANNRRWRWEVQGEQFLGRTVNDANSAAVTWIAVDRTLNVVDTIALTSTALTWNGNPLLSTATAFANPTATIGLAAVNGVATTAMRSDAAPALSQTIAPTWTAQHTFTLVGSNNAFGIVMSSTLPGYVINETDGAANNRAWRFFAEGEQLRFDASDDAGTSSSNWLLVDRTSTTIDQVSFPTTTANSFRIGGAAPTLTNRQATITSGATGILGVTQTGVAGNDCIAIHHQATAGDNSFMQFGTEAAFTTRGSITYNRGAGLVAYNTTSDARRKKNIRDSGEASSIIDAIRVRSFEWADSDNHLDHWLVAQELYAVYPIAVTEGSNDRDWAIDTSKLVPLIVKELQSIRQRLAALETPGQSERAN